jgi:prephenate dehydratase
MRVGFLGPAGTYSEEAVLADGAPGLEPVPLPTVHAAVAAVREGSVERALVPIENSLEGSVNATLDALAQGDGVQIIGELVHPIHHCLIARAAVPLERIAVVASHPQGSGQCAAFIRTRLPGAAVLTAASTADAVRLVAERDPAAGEPWAAIASRAAAALYGCEVLESDIQDPPGSETRFVWIARDAPDPASGGAAWKTALLFWEPDDDHAGWLVRCLAEFADREVNLTRIESRPRREGLGSYMFFVDLDGYAGTPAVAEAIEALRAHAPAVRVLGSFPTAP